MLRRDILEKVEHFIEKFIPENYDLFLDIKRKERTFTGSVKIKGNALKDSISLHQQDLEIKSIKLEEKELSFTMDNENEALHLDLGKTGDVDLVVDFAGKITDNMTGIYPSYYTKDGEKKELVSTQFESHFARQAFPCVDEPVAKATFDLAIKFDQEDDEIVISNMPEIEADKRKETGIWRFETTPIMSSYLLAFVIGDMQNKMTKTKNGTVVGAFSTKAHPLKSLDFALEVAVKSIEFYEDYFGVKYPIPQSLHAAIPDFSAGAMENWGLVTYREIAMLVDDNSTVSSRQSVALTIAHEVAHQWFGNLVTMKWWDDLWLNESFANMMEYVAIDSAYPSWNIIEHFQVGGVGYALKRDATDGVQSVHVEVNHPDEINSLFDPAIVYAKGSRLMHMLRRWLGDEHFSKGLGNYFDKFKYKNTVGKDLWDELSAVSDRDVASFMHSWLEQPGYPVVSLKVEDDKLIISQKQFFIGQHEDKNRLWQVPLNSSWKGLPDTLTTESISIDNYSKLKEENEGALLLNTINTAHYIIKYEGELFDDILANFSKLDKVTKLQVLQDYYFLAEGGEIDYAKLTSLLPLLSNEDSYIVGATVAKLVSGLKRFLDEGSEAEKAFKNIVKGVYKSNFERLGFMAKEGENDDDEMLREITLSSILYAEDEEAIKEASEIFNKYKDDLESIPAAIREVVLANEVKNNESDELVDSYFDLYVKTLDANFQRDLVRALAETKNEKTLEKVISALKDKDIIKPQDLGTRWYASFLFKDYPRAKMWNWACENWDWIVGALGGDMSFDRFVILPGMCFKTREMLDKYKMFFEPKLDNIGISRSIKMGINEIEARVNLVEKEKANVEKAILETRI